MEFKPSKNLAEQIAAHLGERIIRFELKPGERLIEEDLARDLKVSRSPLREALRILEKKWLVDLIPRREARVSVLNEYLITCTGEILKEIYTLVARKAVELGTREDLEAITASLAVCNDMVTLDDMPGYFDAFIEFEATCLKAAKNIVLNRLLKDLWPASRRVQFASMKLRTESLKEHADYLNRAHKSLMERNSTLAIAAVRELIDNEIHSGIKYLPEFNKL